MGQDELVMSIRFVADKIKEDKGVINLFMLLRDNDNSDQYTTIISAKWLDTLNPFDGTKMIVQYFLDNLDAENLKHISRINPVNTNDYGVISITHTFCIEGGVRVFQNCTFNHVIIPYAIIFESNY